MDQELTSAECSALLRRALKGISHQVTQLENNSAVLVLQAWSGHSCAKTAGAPSGPQREVT